MWWEGGGGILTLFCLWPRPRRPRRSPQEHSVRRRVSSRRAPSKAGAKTQVWRERLLYGYRGRARCQQRPLAFFWFFGQSTHPERETDVRARCSYCVPAAKEVEAERAGPTRGRPPKARTHGTADDRPPRRARRRVLRRHERVSRAPTACWACACCPPRRRPPLLRRGWMSCPSGLGVAVVAEVWPCRMHRLE